MAKQSGRVHNNAEMKVVSEARTRAVRKNAKTIRRAARIVDAQEKVANTRAKYGPRMKPAPVVVKSLETGEIVATTKLAPSPAEIERKQTRNGGWTRATLAVWGVPWPPPRGWRRRLEDQWRREKGHAERSEEHDAHRDIVNIAADLKRSG